MFKNTAGQSYRVFAFDRTTNMPITGSATTITAKISQDYGVPVPMASQNPTEVEEGYYLFPLSQEETNCDDLAIYPRSTNDDTIVIGCPANVHPQLDYDRGFLVNLTIKFADGSVVPYCQVVITKTDTSSAEDVFRKATATETGQVEFALPAGTYFLWRNKLNATFNDPATLTIQPNGQVVVTDSFIAGYAV